ncbi:MAG: type II toxin-antitoxin system antitoxin SocA domain-containing protein [Verrucomicrobiota bacterium]
MNFRFDIVKATEVACQFVRREGGTINIMKLVKLVYLLDRLSLGRRGIPLVGGAYFSLPNGPITSEFLDLINSGCLSGQADCHWDDYLSDREGHEVALKAEAPSEHLSPAEVDLINEIYREHGKKDQWELRDWCHEHCEEWTPLEHGRDLIRLERIARAVGKTAEQIERLKEDARELNFLASAFARK